MKISKKIINGIVDRDEHSFNMIYHQYYKLIRHIIYGIVKSHETTEDLIQETFMKMYNNILQYDTSKSFKYWLIQIAKNTARDYLRKEKDKYIIDEEIVDEYPLEDKHEIIEDELLQLVRDIVDNESYEIIILHIYHRLKFKEIAEINNSTTSAVIGKYSRAMQKIKNELKSRKYL